VGDDVGADDQDGRLAGGADGHQVHGVLVVVVVGGDVEQELRQAAGGQVELGVCGGAVARWWGLVAGVGAAAAR